LERRIARTVASFWSAPHLLLHSDYVLTVSERVGSRLAETLPIVLRPPPLEVGHFYVSMLWHQRMDDDSGHRWLRNLLTEVCSQLPEH
jgi:DNA-binding transcriptional LysR family regulator